MLKRIGCLALVAAIIIAALPQSMTMPTVDAFAAGRFLDIGGHPSAAIIERWAELGVAWGNNGYFFPDGFVTRAEFFTMANRTFGATVTDSIWQYRDVSSDAWYYNEIARSYAAGYIQGTSATTMNPNDRITREQVVTLLAQIVGLYAPNASALTEQYTDADQISGYARGFVAAFTSQGWFSADSGVFRPKEYISRAEIIELMDSIFPNFYTGSDFMSGAKLSGNLLIRSPGVTISNMTLDGDLVLGDGVGLGNISLRNCVINGRLVIRGGGPNSVSLSSTTVTEGAYIFNPNGTTRLVSTNDMVRMGIVTARTSTIFEGNGLASVVIPDNAKDGSVYTFRDVALDSLMVQQPSAVINAEGEIIDNLRFLPGADNSALQLDTNSAVNYLEILANGVTVTGSGDVDVAVINGSGAVMSMTPRFLTISPGITATVAGNEVKGEENLLGSGFTNTVSREDPTMAVTRDAANVGGAGLTLATKYSGSANLVEITQDANSAVALSELQRPGYWVGFFVPVPAKYQDPVIRMSYTFEGGSDSIYSLPVVMQNSVNGVVIYIPVKVDNTGKTGVIDTTVYFIWGDATYENIAFKSGTLKLAAATTAQQTKMAGSFSNAQLRAYNKTNVYTGSEALRRLLEGDNALGLDTRGYDRYDEADKIKFASQMYIDRSSLTSQKAIQDYINTKTNFIGALYAVNRASSAPELQTILETADMADQLAISTGSGSAYAALSAANRLGVATDLLLGRKTAYADEPAVAAAFEKSVNDRRAKEVTLIASINATTSDAAMQKLLENKANTAMIGIVVDGDPYKSAAASTKLMVAQNVVTGRLYTSLDDVKKKFEELIGTPDNPVKFPPELDPNIMSVAANTADLTLTLRGVDTVVATINTASGSFSDPAAVTWSIDKTTIATVDATGKVTGVALGKAKLTITSKVDTKKKTTVNIVVVNAVPVVSVSLNYTKLDLTMGQVAQLLPTIIPANGTDKLHWYTDDPSVATISDGYVTAGNTPGFTNITVRTDTGISAVCQVFVGSDTPSVTILQTQVRVGIDCTVQLDARVSPATASDRTILWSTNDADTAYVNSQGVVTGKKSGAVTITATSRMYPGVSASCTVIVDDTLRGVYMKENKLTMYKGGVKDLDAYILPAGSGDPEKDLVWSVSSGAPDIVDIINKDTGEIKAKNAGSVVVTATLKDDPTAFDTCTITVSPTDLKVTVAPKSIKMEVYDQSLITVAMTPPPENPLIDFSSSDEKVATVSADGIVTAVGKGTAIIRVTPQANSQLTTVSVTVTEVALKSFTVNPSTIQIIKGDRERPSVSFEPSNATNKNLTWSSSRPGCVQIETGEDGIVYLRGLASTLATATGLGGEILYDPGPVVYARDPSGSLIELSPGVYATETSMIPRMVDNPAIITVMSYNGIIRSMSVSVIEANTQKVEEVELVLKDWVFPVGYSRTLNYLLNNGDVNRIPHNSKVTWTCEPSNVAVVDSAGVLTTKSPGTAVITVTSDDTAVKSSKTIVVAPVGITGLNFTGKSTGTDYGPNYIIMNLTNNTDINGQKNVGAVLSPSDATNSMLYYQVIGSTPTSVVSLTSSGGLTAKAPGVAVISVTPEKTNNPSYSGSAYPDAAEVNREMSLITGSGASLKGPNSNLLDSSQTYALVVNRPLSPYQTQLTVIVDPSPPSSFTPADGQPATLYLNEPYTLTGTYNHQNATIDTITPNINGSATESTPVVSNGNFSVTITPTAVGNLSVNYTLGMNAWTVQVPYWKYNDTGGYSLAYATRTVSAGSKSFDKALNFTVAYRPAESISITNKPSKQQSTGTSLNLSAAIYPPNADQTKVTWESDNNNIATVDQTGKVTFKSSTGSVKITARANGTAYSDSVEFDVGTVAATGSTFSLGFTPITTMMAPVGGSISPTYIKLRGAARVEVGKTLKLYPDVLPYNADALVWSSSDSTIAMVDSNGEVTGISLGRATITLASADGSISSECRVTVSKPPSVNVTKVRVNLSKITMLKGKDMDLGSVVSPMDAGNKGVGWYSSNPSVVRVSPTGKVYALKAGVAVVTVVSDDGGLTGTCTVTVRVPVSSVTMSVSEATLKVDEEKQLYYTITPSDASNTVATWSTSNSKVATVSVDGRVTAVKSGTAEITVTVGGKKTTCTITVKDK